MAKLLHISANAYPPLYGRHHHTKNIWQELAGGFEEYHILARSENNAYSYSHEGNIHLHLVPRLTQRSKIFFLTSFWMFWLIKKYNITHLLSQCPIAGGVTAALASRFFRIPLMVELHGEEYFRLFQSQSFFGRISTALMRYTFRHARKIRSLNDAMTQKLIQNKITENIVLIPNRVNLAIFNKQKKDFVLKGPLKIISVGRFVWEKNYLNLMRCLHANLSDFHLTLVGGGKLKDEYERYIHENNLDQKVRLIEWIDQKELVDLIVSSDLYVQYSLSEGMPRTIVEAMALQMPIISTDVGSISGVLTDRSNALVIGSDSCGGLTHAIGALMQDAFLRESIATQAYRDVVEKYEWNKVFELYKNEIAGMRYEHS